MEVIFGKLCVLFALIGGLCLCLILLPFAVVETLINGLVYKDWMCDKWTEICEHWDNAIINCVKALIS